VIETVDRPRLAEALAIEIARSGRCPQLYVQVNTGAEAQKAGILPGDADAFIRACRDVHGLTIAGLMCIPPADQPPTPHFALLAKIAARNGIATLSMGMSADYNAGDTRSARRMCGSAARFFGRAALIRGRRPIAR